VCAVIFRRQLNGSLEYASGFDWGFNLNVEETNLHKAVRIALEAGFERFHELDRLDAIAESVHRHRPRTDVLGEDLLADVERRGSEDGLEVSQRKFGIRLSKVLFSTERVFAHQQFSGFGFKAGIATRGYELFEEVYAGVCCCRQPRAVECFSRG
jgi:hypothetical protein